MRMFVALNLPEDAREALYAATKPLRDAGLPVRWLKPESLHITLKFLGWVRPEDTERVAGTAAEAASKTRNFELPIGGLGAFPTRRRPRVIWAGVEATPALRCLKHDLEWLFTPLGFEREIRAFQPHVTLGRTHPDAGAGEFRELEKLFEEVKFETVVPVREVDLMSSRLAPSGAEYERIASAPLG